jgi:hypothetical protein
MRLNEDDKLVAVTRVTEEEAGEGNGNGGEA